MQQFPWLCHCKNRWPPPDTKVAHPTPADHTRGSFSSRLHPYLRGFSKHFWVWNEGRKKGQVRRVFQKPITCSNHSAPHPHRTKSHFIRFTCTSGQISVRILWLFLCQSESVVKLTSNSQQSPCSRCVINITYERTWHLASQSSSKHAFSSIIHCKIVLLATTMGQRIS